MSKIILNELSTRAPEDLDKDEIEKITDDYVDQLKDLQAMLYAEGKHSILIVLQGMDTSGKDGVVKKVLKSVNPHGMKLHSFKKPTEEEMAHDFLWRVHKHTPAKGMIQVFNRSHYEDVLITRVKGWVDDDLAHRRFAIINSFEELLEERGTKILKFYLHISEEKQRERFRERLEIPRKNWKYNEGDLLEAKSWPAYRQVYQDVFEHCSPEGRPWMMVPSDQKWYKEYLIAKKLVETLESLNMSYPTIDKEKIAAELAKLEESA